MSAQEGSEPDISWEEVQKLESSMATSGETLGEGLTPITGELGDLTLEGAAAQTKGESGATASLYPEVSHSFSGPAAGGKKVKGPKCCGCGKSIRKDQIDAAFRCKCPAGDPETPATYCHKGCRATIVKVIAASRGYTDANGVGDEKHPEVVTFLNTAAPFYAEAGSGLVAGYLDNDGIYCARCISSMQTPCVSRHLFDRNAEESSSDEEQARLGAGDDTFTTAVSGAAAGQEEATGAEGRHETVQ
eukprot:CAMPEP_0181342970 /NCGR_PEP_ID=MMETSP1101-20121128/31314_1 /TAXON_ID=46948 /ORGANISM="Rhodomonas abbreviata, Strain Caron Lab Isolate" /LENGTH=245 /DNA_ID=CAMNT_0023454523 /DNA_START=323 /DNA_END=1057 /DNA_ORIENTATION=+